MTVNEQAIKPHADKVLELLAINHEQGRIIFDPSPQIDSLSERIAHLHQHGVPPHVIRALFADLRQLLNLNREEGEGEYELAGILDELATPHPVTESLNVKGLARALREPLATLREHPADLRALRQVRRTVRLAGPDRLHGSLIGELGKGPHAQLIQLMGEWS